MDMNGLKEEKETKATGIATDLRFQLHSAMMSRSVFVFMAVLLVAVCVEAGWLTHLNDNGGNVEKLVKQVLKVNNGNRNPNEDDVQNYIRQILTGSHSNVNNFGSKIENIQKALNGNHAHRFNGNNGNEVTGNGGANDPTELPTSNNRYIFG